MSSEFVGIYVGCYMLCFVKVPLLDIESKPKAEGSSCSEQANPHTRAKSFTMEACCESGSQEKEACGVTNPPSGVLSPPLPPPPPVTVASTSSSPDQAASVDEHHSLTRFVCDEEVDV